MILLSEPQKRILASTDWFQQLCHGSRTFVLHAIRVLELSHRQRLYSRGDEGDGFHCVLSGRVKVSNLHRSGKQMVLAYLSQGSWFGEISMFDGKGRTHDTEAEGNAQLAFMSRQHFHELLAHYPAVHGYFIQMLCARLRTTFSYIDASASLTPRQQLARRLILLASNFGQSPAAANNTEIHASQETLAMMLNMSRQTVNQLMKQLQQDNLIQQRYGRISLLDMDALKALGDWNAEPLRH
ncbi:Crp/Fnr family transcriptional regulator [Alteromonas oceanisediminis]|uniref:Crp/Fnr family transcriptional regulator n=1 Tax=Alteromonas oceanisediminis TaxID=2836180 RepID=UPI001BDB08B7|nr:Crp/Fnr family transcriptional regulator [Alteromonas oceanisediminis]MBT0587430.1 Crp/Fnr family transcriptional regulator [Alteromonas oceanisediminis]